MNNFLIIGGAGFIGSNLARVLIENNKSVTILDDLSSGKLEFLNDIKNNNNLKFLKDDLTNWANLEFGEIDVIVHLASNPDIAASVNDPTLDFYKGTLLTQFAAEIARFLKIKKFIYASGSGVYGDYGNEKIGETTHEFKPISPYGASKLSGEAILSAYGHMYEFDVVSLRFGNVVGPNQTHGVGYDFMNKLRAKPKILKVLGNGLQEKSYIHVQDVISAILLVIDKKLSLFESFNVATFDVLKVSDIVKIALEVANISLTDIKIEFENVSRGWKGDVPIVKLDSSKIRQIGWSNKLNSTEAMQQALISLWERK